MRRASGSKAATVAGLITLVAAAGALASAKTGPYAGATAQPGQSINFEVVKKGKGKDVQNVGVNSVLVNCTSSSGTQTVNAPLEKGGDFPIKHKKFKFAGKININTGNVPVAQGNGKLNGKFSSNHEVNGSFQFSWNFNQNAPNGLQGAHCDSGTVTYTAKHS